jgi:hypothetical protein
MRILIADQPTAAKGTSISLNMKRNRLTNPPGGIRNRHILHRIIIADNQTCVRCERPEFRPGYRIDLPGEIIIAQNRTVSTFSFDADVCFPCRYNQLFDINAILDKDRIWVFGIVAARINGLLNSCEISAAVLRNDKIVLL